jgi:hypothetical protein
MSKLLGEYFESYVDKQIDIRQKKLGKSFKNNEDLIWSNSNTAWSKLVSLSDIVNDDSGNEVIKKLGLTNQYKGIGELAKNYILWHGIGNNNIGIESHKKGLEKTNNIINNSSYDLSSTMGYKPMPGLISIDITHKNNGSLRQAIVTMKAHSIEQFNIIDVLYLRLGFHIFLEWGNSVYFDNNNILVKNNITLANEIVNGKLNGDYVFNWENILKKIQTKRKESDGNYDALLGRVTNFDWTFRSDGTYNIILNITSIGDIIESLKMNLYSQENSINLNNKINDKSEVNTFESNVIEKRLNYLKYSYLKDGKDYNEQKDGSNIKEAFDILSLNLDGKREYWVQYDKNQPLPPQYYFRFKNFLDWIQNVSGLLLNNPKIIKINTDEKSNLFYSIPGQKSMDSTILTTSNNINNVLTSFIYQQEGIYAGQLMNLYINFDFIIKTLEDVTQDGKANLRDFLQGICDGINRALGNINKIQIKINEDKNEVIFIDEIQIPGYNKLRNTFKEIEKTENVDEPTLFKLYGVELNKNGSFIKDFGIKTTISNNIKNTIAIGAQARNEDIGEDQIAFLSWNKGLKDRLSPNLLPEKESRENFSIELSKDLDILKEKYKNINFNDTLNNEKIEENIQIANKYLTNTQQLYSISNNSTSPLSGFIPINLNLTMDGISGIKIFQAFTIEQKFLPYNYNEQLEFLIKNISHTIKNNIWETSIESLSIPNVKNDKSPIETVKIIPITTCGTPFINNDGLSKLKKLPLSIKNQNKLDKIIKDIYRPDPALGLCGRYTYNIVRLWKNNNENILSTEINDTNNILKISDDNKIENKYKSGGNAKFMTNGKLVKEFNYKKTRIGSNISFNTLSQYIILLENNYINNGDIIIYWSNDRPDINSGKYGHICIYNNKKWYSDINQTSGLVYNISEGNCWELYVLSQN